MISHASACSEPFGLAASFITAENVRMQMEPSFEPIGAVLAEISRKQMLCALMDGRAHTSKELALCAGISASTASGHLAMMRDTELILSEKSGRTIYHRLAGPEVAALLEGLAALVPPSFAARLRSVHRKDPDSLTARCCYDHIAGRLGVGICDALQRVEAIEIADGAVRVGNHPGLLKHLAGLEVTPGQIIGRSCLDWSERRSHLSGNIGRALLAHWQAQAWLTRPTFGRGLRVTQAGQAVIENLSIALV